MPRPVRRTSVSRIFPAVIGTTYQTPDIANNLSFEGSAPSAWDGWTDWGGNPTPVNVSLDNTQAKDGVQSVVRSWTPNPSSDLGDQFIYHFGTVAAAKDRVWFRFYFKLTAHITTTFKFTRFYDNVFTDPKGGFFVDSGSNIVLWGWDLEDASITTPIGLAEASVIDGNWHSLEVDYWRNGDPSGWPSARFWFDNVSQSLPDNTPVTGQGAGNFSYWLGGSLYAGQRASAPSVMNGQLNIGYMSAFDTLNMGNTTTGQVNFDKVSFSSLGRIGP